MTFPRCVISVPMLRSIWPGWQHQKFEKFMVFGISWQWRHHRWRLEWRQWQKWIQSRELKSLFCPVNIDLKNHTYSKIRILNNFESQNICFVKNPEQNKVKKELEGRKRVACNNQYLPWLVAFKRIYLVSISSVSRVSHYESLRPFRWILAIFSGISSQR